MNVYKSCFVLFLVVIQLLPAVGITDDNLDVSNCVSMLGTGYDKLSNTQKQQRFVKFGGCVHNGASLKIDRNYKDIVSKVDNWGINAIHSANLQIDKKAESTKDHMKAAHKLQFENLYLKYKKKTLALSNSASGNQNISLNDEIKKLLALKREEEIGLKVKHQAEITAYLHDVRISKETERNRITEMVQNDKTNLLNQQKVKLDYIDKQMDIFINTPLNKTINEYNSQANQGGLSANDALADNTLTDEWFADDDSAPPKPPEWLRSIFVFTSGLIGHDDPEEKDYPMGDLGGRG